MPNYLSRLIVAFCLSAACFMATEDWYRRSKTMRTHDGNSQPIALLQDLTNEVQRKPLTRIIWETISKDEDLYPGEAIRTSTQSEAKIQFLKTGTVIELEPESLVVLEETDRGLSLDFVKGNLFVKNNGNQTSTQEITLKSGNSEINLQKAELSLSKDSGDQLDIQVFGGKAQVKQNGKTLTLDSSQTGSINSKDMEVNKSQIQITSPLAGDTLYINAKNKENVLFKWNPLSKDYLVFIEKGSNRKKLIRLPLAGVKGDSGQLSVASKVGKFYWRLWGEPNHPGLPPLKSPIISFEILTQRPPVPLEPLNQAALKIEELPLNLRFKWANPAHLDPIILEIAKDSQLKDSLIRENVDDKVGFKDLALPSAGKYFWRLIGYMNIKGKTGPVSSEIQEFSTLVGIELIPPRLRSPSSHQSIPFNQALEKGLILTWDSIPGINRYQLSIEKENGEVLLSKELSTSPARAKDLKPGSYRWTVRSLNSSDKKSEPAPYQFFSITDMPVVEWARGPEPEEYLYFTQKPSVILQWLRGTNNMITSWRYHMSLQEKDLPQSTWLKIDQPAIRSSLPSEGLWWVEVEALNNKNQSIAKSSIKQIKITPKPLLPGPQFASELPETLKASRKGDLNLKWDPVPGAKKYQVQLRSPAGKLIKSDTVDSNVSQMDRLKPGQYEVSLQSIDEHNRPGPVNTPRKLEVPKVSDIAAPKIKAFQIK